MINLRNKTEFSLKSGFGLIDDVLATNQGSAAGICDRGGTWGHVQWQTKCKAAGIKPLFGVEIAFVYDMNDKRNQPKSYMALIAKNADGLKELYDWSTLSTEKRHYEPRLDYSILREISDNIIILSGNTPCWERLTVRDNLYIEISPSSLAQTLTQAKAEGFNLVATGANDYCRPSDRPAYEIIVGRNADSRSTPQHIISETEWRLYWQDESAIANTHLIADMCNVELTPAAMVCPPKPKSLRVMCEDGAADRDLTLDKEHQERLDRELNLIGEKEFEDYFYVVADICRYAKEHMLVGPARGSSCGSLVCYLLGITEIDPIEYGLLFERFIDINRMDYPDIDIDFPDGRREMVFDYIKDKYGYENVARLGAMARFKAKSTLIKVGTALQIPPWELNDLKGAIIERSGGDARAQFCILDTFESLAIGQKALAAYPELKVAADIEGHASHAVQHAAGMIVTANPVSWYCTVDEGDSSVAQIDKYDAEALNMLKIDILGLRTLSVMQDVLDHVGWNREKLMRYDTKDQAAFAVLNNEQFGGIFQFEGYALQSLCKQLVVESFEDIVSLTALARPGPLISGGATSFLKRRNGDSPIEYLHPQTEDITKITYGVIVYQEQVMQVAREIGGLSWEDVSSLRKAMSKSLGKEFFDQYWEKFKVGAAKQGINEEHVEIIWESINSMGSWAFNRSHAVAYGLMSYWCCVLKAHFPLEFAAACLRNAKDKEQSIKILRELYKEGYKYKSFDRDTSEANWSIQDGCLVGGFSGIKGIGQIIADDIVECREAGEPMNPHHRKLLDSGVTPYDIIFEAQERWGHISADPMKYDISSALTKLEDIKSESHGEFVFIAKLVEKNLRDHNELVNVERRGGKEMSGQTLFLDLTVEDDTSPILCAIDRYKYERIGLAIVNEGRIDDWYIFKGFQRRGFRKVRLLRLIKLTDNPKYAEAH